jgi:hypothetical protein
MIRINKVKKHSTDAMRMYAEASPVCWGLEELLPGIYTYEEGGNM